jgi:hypothetical protein
MKLEPDDNIWRARLVWLGSKTFTMPIQMPYAQWLVFAVLFAAATGLLFAVFHSAVVVGTGFGVAFFLTTWIWQHVDPDRPARKVVRTALTDWHTDKTDGTGGELEPLDASRITIGADR